MKIVSAIMLLLLLMPGAAADIIVPLEIEVTNSSHFQITTDGQTATYPCNINGEFSYPLILKEHNPSYELVNYELEKNKQEIQEAKHRENSSQKRITELETKINELRTELQKGKIPNQPKEERDPFTPFYWLLTATTVIIVAAISKAKSGKRHTPNQ